MNLSQQQIDFIIDLSNEMRTQDTRCTAQPYGLILTEEVIEVHGKDHGSYCGINWNGDSYDDYQIFKENVIEHFDGEETQDWYEDVIDNDCFYDLWGSTRNNSELYFFWYERTKVPTLMHSNFFLTEKGYESYISKDRHNLTKPESFGIHLRRNDEMAQVIEIIHTIADQLKQEPIP